MAHFAHFQRLASSLGVGVLAVGSPFHIAGYGTFATLATLRRLARWYGLRLVWSRTTWRAPLGQVRGFVCCVRVSCS